MNDDTARDYVLAVDPGDTTGWCLFDCRWDSCRIPEASPPQTLTTDRRNKIIATGFVRQGSDDWDALLEAIGGEILHPEIPELFFPPNTLAGIQLQSVFAVAVEDIVPYGIVGMDVLNTVKQIGAIEGVACIAGRPCFTYTRPEVLEHLVANRKATKAQCSTRIRDELGEFGTKKKPGPLYELKQHGSNKRHVFDALAVALTYADRHSAWPRTTPWTATKGGAA